MVTEEKRKQELIIGIREKRKKKREIAHRRKRRIKLMSLTTIAALIIVTVSAMYNTFAMDITITEINEFAGVNHTYKVIRAKGDSVEKILSDKGLEVGDTDRLNIPADRELKNDENIVLTRGKRVTIKADGCEDTVTITKADAHDALVEAGYVPGEKDSIRAKGDTIELVTRDEVDEVISEKIERGVEYVEDANTLEGQEKVVEEGQDGIREVSVTVKYVNGEESERITTGEKITLEPKNKVIAKGTLKPTPTPTPAAKKPKTSNSSQGTTAPQETAGTIDGHSYSKKIVMSATAYTADPKENAGYTTSAMGNPLRYGIVAVDPNVIPLGSKVYVTSTDGSWTYGVASAEDTGGAIKGNKIDLCYPNGGISFGRKNCVVYILN